MSEIYEIMLVRKSDSDCVCSVCVINTNTFKVGYFGWLLMDFTCKLVCC